MAKCEERELILATRVAVETCLCDVLLTEELDAIEAYTIQKINNYPSTFGKTVINYFDVLFPDEIKNYLVRREINTVAENGLR